MTTFARRALVGVAGMAAALGLTATSAAAADWGQPVPGQHVYDMAHVLTTAQVADLESAAADVDRAGAPAIVYVRLEAADDATTRTEARDLMSAWAVESIPGARDGFVTLLDLRPGDTKHGSAALVAGATHVSDGKLPDGRLQTIYDGTMKSRLAEGDLAGALSAALSEVAADLRAPMSAPLGTTPVNAGGVLGAVGVGVGLVVLVGLVVAGSRRGGRSRWNDPDRGLEPGPTDRAWHSGDFRSSSTTTTTYTGGDGGASSGSSSGGGSF